VLTDRKTGKTKVKATFERRSEAESSWKDGGGEGPAGMSVDELMAPSNRTTTEVYRRQPTHEY